MDKARQLMDVEQLEVMKAFKLFLSEQADARLKDAVGEAVSNPNKSAALLLCYSELKDLWSNFRSSYETIQTNTDGSS